MILMAATYDIDASATLTLSAAAVALGCCWQCCEQTESLSDKPITYQPAEFLPTVKDNDRRTVGTVCRIAFGKANTTATNGCHV